MNTSPSYLLSDVDEQLLLNISVGRLPMTEPRTIDRIPMPLCQFNQLVRIRSILVKGSVADQQPRLIKLFINRPTLGFSDAEDAKEPEAAQIIELTAEQVAQGRRIPLRFVRFQNVNSLHVRRVSRVWAGCGMLTSAVAACAHTDLCRDERRGRADADRCGRCVRDTRHWVSAIEHGGSTILIGF